MREYQPASFSLSPSRECNLGILGWVDLAVLPKACPDGLKKDGHFTSLKSGPRRPLYVISPSKSKRRKCVAENPPKTRSGKLHISYWLWFHSLIPIICHGGPLLASQKCSSFFGSTWTIVYYLYILHYPWYYLHNQERFCYKSRARLGYVFLAWLLLKWSLPHGRWSAEFITKCST